MNIHTALRSGPLLGISLDKDAYIPGDIITGHVFRQFQTISPDATVSICMFGRGRTIGVIGNNSQEYRGLFDLCYRPKIIFQGPIHIESSKHKHKWPFTVQLPKYVNDSTPLAPVNHTPPSYMLRTKNMAAVIEYVIKAKITMAVQGHEEVLEATFPFKVRCATPESPIADFQLKRYYYQRAVSSHRLIPGMQDTKVSWKDKIKQSLHSSKDPALTFDLFVEVPKVVQLDNPTPIPFTLLVSPNWEETSDAIRDVVQDVELVSVRISVVTTTTIICHAGLQVPESTEIDLGLSQAIKQRGTIPFDEGKNTFTEKFEEDAITSFITTSATPLIGEVGPETYSSYMSAGIPLAYIFSETPEERKELGDALKPIAEKFKGKINFATIDAKAFGAHAGNLNLKADKFPSFAIQEVVKNQKFPFDQEKQITHDNIAKFVEDFAAGKIEPSIKSEPIPETQEGPVTVVVAKSYNDIVLDDTKDVLIEFYAPWCGHCKALAPKYDDLASQFAASEFKDKVVIAKVDATLNDVPDEIQGFPTIKLYAAGAKDAPVTYQGSRTVEDLANFIKENGKYKAELPVKEEGTEEAAPAASEEKKDAEEEDVHDEL